MRSKCLTTPQAHCKSFVYHVRRHISQNKKITWICFKNRILCPPLQNNYSSDKHIDYNKQWKIYFSEMKRNQVSFYFLCFLIQLALVIFYLKFCVFECINPIGLILWQPFCRSTFIAHNEGNLKSILPNFHFSDFCC